MTDLPKTVHIVEEGPREGFHFKRQAVPTARKIELIEALAETGLDTIQAVSFVDSRRVPGWADADAVVAGLRPREGVAYRSALAEREGAPAGARAPRPAGALRLGLALRLRDLHAPHQNRGSADNAAVQAREIETCWRTACQSRGSR